MIEVRRLRGDNLRMVRLGGGLTDSPGDTPMKLRRSLALMVALGGLAGTAMTGNVLMAQTPKKDEKKADDKKATPKDDKKPAAKASGKVIVYEGKKGWRYRVENAEEKTIAMATKNYDTKDEVIKELENIKSILNNSKPEEGKAKD